jgi:hypothetical protein
LWGGGREKPTIYNRGEKFNKRKKAKRKENSIYNWLKLWAISLR